MSETHQIQFDAYRVRYLTGAHQQPAIDCYRGKARVGEIVFHSGPDALPAVRPSRARARPSPCSSTTACLSSPT